MKTIASISAVAVALLLSGCGAGAADYPEGFTDVSGAGVAFRWTEDDAAEEDCDCLELEIYAYEDCLGGVFVTASIYDEKDRVIGETIESLSSLATGQTGVLDIVYTDEYWQSASIEDISCY